MIWVLNWKLSKRWNLAGGGEFELEIVTEMPVGLFKKANLNKYNNGGRLGIGDGGQEPYKPVFSYRNSS